MGQAIQPQNRRMSGLAEPLEVRRHLDFYASINVSGHDMNVNGDVMCQGAESALAAQLALTGEPKETV